MRHRVAHRAACRAACGFFWLIFVAEFNVHPNWTPKTHGLIHQVSFFQTPRAYPKNQCINRFIFLFCFRLPRAHIWQRGAARERGQPDQPQLPHRGRVRPALLRLLVQRRRGHQLFKQGRGQHQVRVQSCIENVSCCDSKRLFRRLGVVHI
jgi:hypothetical protein